MFMRQTFYGVSYSPSRTVWSPCFKGLDFSDISVVQKHYPFLRSEMLSVTALRLQRGYGHICVQTGWSHSLTGKEACAEGGEARLCQRPLRASV